jgi:HK97 family phage major capsid protein
MNKIKQLSEQRAKLLKDAAALSTDKAEDRASLTKLHEQITEIDEKIGLEARQLELLNPQPIGLSDKEVREYSLTRAIAGMVAQMTGTGSFDGLEAEASAAIAKRSGRQAQGFFIPVEITHGTKQQRNLVAGTGSAGGFTVPTELQSPIIELLRNTAQVAGLGARILSGLTGNVSIPRQTGATTAQWLAETAEANQVDQTFGQLAMTPKRLAARSGYSLQLIRQSSVQVEGFVRDDQAQVLGLAVDLAAIQGTGSGGQPLGIVGTSGVGTITFSAAATYAKYIDAIAALLTANSMAGTPAFLGSPAAWSKGKTIPRVSGAGATAMIIGADNTVDGYRFVPSNHLPSNRLIFGDFSQLIIGYFGEPDVVVDPFTKAANGLVVTTTNHYMDIGVRQAAAFVVSTDSAAQ